MSEISHEVIDNFFKQRPQLKPPPKGLFGYKIDRRWYDFLYVLLNYPGSITAGEVDAPHCELSEAHGEFKSLGYNECPDCGELLTHEPLK